MLKQSIFLSVVLYSFEIKGNYRNMCILVSGAIYIYTYRVDLISEDFRIMIMIPKSRNH